MKRQKDPHARAEKLRQWFSIGFEPWAKGGTFTGKIVETQGRELGDAPDGTAGNPTLLVDIDLPASGGIISLPFHMELRISSPIVPIGPYQEVRLSRVMHDPTGEAKPGREKVLQPIGSEPLDALPEYLSLLPPQVLDGWESAYRENPTAYQALDPIFALFGEARARHAEIAQYLSADDDRA